MKLLMHICCANCGIVPLQRLHLKNIAVRGLWFNPNIHPLTEYARRLESVRSLGRFWSVDIEYDETYDLDAFLSAVVNRGAERCAQCYGIRLDRTAGLAKKMNLDGFTTSLLASPYQKFDMILEKGREAGMRHGVTFYAEDFRDGWMASRDRSREFGFYRQRYCGCVYSEMERYRKGRK